MIVTSVQIKTAKTQKHLYCPVFTNKAENESFSALFFAFSRQNRVFSHHFRTTRNSENFLTTCLTTVGAGAIRLVASAPVRSAHEKLNSKGSRRYSLREPFSLFPAYQFLSLHFIHH